MMEGLSGDRTEDAVGCKRSRIGWRYAAPDSPPIVLPPGKKECNARPDESL
jgi:hypothetical protein